MTPKTASASAGGARGEASGGAGRRPSRGPPRPTSASPPRRRLPASESGRGSGGSGSLSWSATRAAVPWRRTKARSPPSPSPFETSATASTNATLKGEPHSSALRRLGVPTEGERSRARPSRPSRSCSGGLRASSTPGSPSARDAPRRPAWRLCPGYTDRDLVRVLQKVYGTLGLPFRPDSIRRPPGHGAPGPRGALRRTWEATAKPRRPAESTLEKSARREEDGNSSRRR